MEDDLFWPSRRGGAGAPFEAGGKRGAPAPARPRVDHRLHDRFRLHRSGGQQSLVAAVSTIVIQAQRINHANAGAGEPLLLRQIGNRVHGAVAQGMRATLEESGCVQAGHILLLYRPVGHAPARGLHFDERFEPEGPARTVAYDLNGLLVPRGLGLERAHHSIRTQRHRRCFAGYIDSDGHFLALANSASNRSGVTPACNSLSIISDGPQAQLPRQYTGSSVKPPSALVPSKSTPRTRLA